MFVFLLSMIVTKNALLRLSPDDLFNQMRNYAYVNTYIHGLVYENYLRQKNRKTRRESIQCCNISQRPFVISKYIIIVYGLI